MERDDDTILEAAAIAASMPGAPSWAQDSALGWAERLYRPGDSAFELSGRVQRKLLEEWERRL